MVPEWPSFWHAQALSLRALLLIRGNTPRGAPSPLSLPYLAQRQRIIAASSGTESPQPNNSSASDVTPSELKTPHSTGRPLSQGECCCN
ncbi:hypothetical protein E2C01_030512 [Portunus trituberculatus]|uniref:Uncharacterized protein n=1 Tax=Portunus trituberculatus TaxID=210409 RepID=A0A5B7EQM3_PORTR|nr:hypothetical protein [Portunus trituberculatus]